MKKLLAFMGLAVTTASMMFANVELNTRLFGDFTNIKTEEEIYFVKTEMDLDFSLFGAEFESNFWFAHPWILDIGLSTALDAGFGTGKTKISATIAGQTVSVTDEEATGAAGFSIAPAVQFNLGKKNSIFFAPGFRFAVIDWVYEVADEYETSTEDRILFSPEFTLDAGYKFWLLNFLALNVGYQLELPLGITDMAEGEKLEYDSALAHRVYLGVCLNLGKRNTGSAE